MFLFLPQSHRQLAAVCLTFLSHLGLAMPYGSRLGDVQLNSASTMGDAIMNSSPNDPIEMELSIIGVTPS